jgi:hypothetical protein
VSPKPPSDEAPPLLVDVDYTGQPDGLAVVSTQPGNVTGQPFADKAFRDAILDAELGLLEGADEDHYGIFFRQTASERYVACMLTPGGQLQFGLVNGGPPLVIAGGPLPSEVPFNHGVGATNRVSIVSCGPMAAVILNGAVLVGVSIPQEYGHGACGALLAHTSSTPEARVGVRWAQARALLPDQSPA